MDVTGREWTGLGRILRDGDETGLGWTSLDGNGLDWTGRAGDSTRMDGWIEAWMSGSRSWQGWMEGWTDGLTHGYGNGDTCLPLQLAYDLLTCLLTDEEE